MGQSLDRPAARPLINKRTYEPASPYITAGFATVELSPLGLKIWPLALVLTRAPRAQSISISISTIERIIIVIILIIHIAAERFHICFVENNT
jgi:hypothetical protein